MKTYWLALVELSSPGAELRTGEPRGGIVWVIGAGTTQEAFRAVVTEAHGFDGFVIREWMELAELEPGYRCDAFDGDEWWQSSRRVAWRSSSMKSSGTWRTMTEHALRAA